MEKSIRPNQDLVPALKASIQNPMLTYVKVLLLMDGFAVVYLHVNYLEIKIILTNNNLNIKK